LTGKEILNRPLPSGLSPRVSLRISATPPRRSFAAAGVKIGDFFRLKVGAGSPAFSRITGYADDSLYLQSSSPDFSQNLKSRAFKVSVLRVPFDARQNGVQLPDHPSEAQRLSNFSTRPGDGSGHQQRRSSVPRSISRGVGAIQYLRRRGDCDRPRAYVGKGNRHAYVGGRLLFSPMGTVFEQVPVGSFADEPRSGWAFQGRFNGGRSYHA
jgi:hypothetical protein